LGIHGEQHLAAPPTVASATNHVRRAPRHCTVDLDAENVDGGLDHDAGEPVARAATHRSSEVTSFDADRVEG
jgi:hypothetical protein